MPLISPATVFIVPLKLWEHQYREKARTKLALSAMIKFKKAYGPMEKALYRDAIIHNLICAEAERTAQRRMEDEQDL